MIVDASVAFKWLFRESGSDAATALVGRIDLFAPSLLLIEIGNALWKKSRQGELGDEQAYAVQIALVASLVTVIDDAPTVPRALALAVTLDHAIYDCVYLALAEARGDVMVTADARFVAKAEAAGMGNLIGMLQ